MLMADCYLSKIVQRTLFALERISYFTILFAYLSRESPRSLTKIPISRYKGPFPRAAGRAPAAVARGGGVDALGHVYLSVGPLCRPVARKPCRASVLALPLLKKETPGEAPGVSFQVRIRTKLRVGLYGFAEISHLTISQPQIIHIERIIVHGGVAHELDSDLVEIRPGGGLCGKVVIDH